MQRVHITVCGRVQGVWFRASTARQGRALGLYGWVRNLPDGRVEVLAEGPRPELLQLIDYCSKGPPLARVDELESEWEAAQGGLEPFGVQY